MYSISRYGRPKYTYNMQLYLLQICSLPYLYLSFDLTQAGFDLQLQLLYSHYWLASDSSKFWKLFSLFSKRFIYGSATECRLSFYISCSIAFHSEWVTCHILVLSWFLSCKNFWSHKFLRNCIYSCFSFLVSYPIFGGN